MTNEEMIFCVLKEHTLTDREQLAMLAELKDKQFAEEKQAWIDKACEWILDNIYDDYSPEEFKQQLEEILKDFRKVMKGGNNGQDYN